MYFLPIFLSVPKILKPESYFIEEKIFINPSNYSSKTITTDVLMGSNKLSSKPKDISTDFLSALILALGIETDFIFHQDINKQHVELMKWKLAKLIFNYLNFKLDECVIFIENNYNKFEELSKNERLF